MLNEKSAPLFSSCNPFNSSPITPPLSAPISPDGTDQTHLPSIADIPPHLLIIFKDSQTSLLMEEIRFDPKDGLGRLYITMLFIY